MILVDTHIFFWFQIGDSNLDNKAIKILKNAHEKGELFVSAISIWEIAMLEKAGKIILHQPLDVWVEKALSGFKLIPIDAAIAIESVQLPNLEHKDPADRMILATTRLLGCKLLTKDKVLLKYAKKGYLDFVK